MVLADLGCMEFKKPEHRLSRKKDDEPVPVCTPTYRPPEMFLGDQRFGEGLDAWSVGCLAAELYLRKPLFDCVDGDASSESDIVQAQADLLGEPPTWMTEVPVARRHLSKGKGKGAGFPVLPEAPPEWPPDRLQACPQKLLDFVQDSLKWNPRDRPSAAVALQHPFLIPPAVPVVLSEAKGRHGASTITAGYLDDDLLEYLRTCPNLADLVTNCKKTNFAPNNCMGQEEGELRMKGEYPGYVEADNPPRTMSLNGDKDLQPVSSHRLRSFVKALRRSMKPWLKQLTERVRKEIVKQGLPSEFLVSNGKVFTEEDMADNAFVYASIQVLKVGQRDDGWHTDGGASLLHAGLTLFGSRELQIQVEDQDGCISAAQKPGSFYVGNLCAISHNVRHGALSEGCYGDGPPEDRLQIAVMLRSDFFRENRARRLNAAPGPKPLFDLVNSVTAKHLADVPWRLPSLQAVVSESRMS